MRPSARAAEYRASRKSHRRYAPRDLIFPAALALGRMQGLALEPDATTYFLGRETLVPGEKPSMKSWRVGLYMWLASNALSPARFYHLPPGRVVELGTQVSI